jgi:lipoate-protein ligase A
MTNGLFNALDVYHDDAPHSAAMNMAIDEALLKLAAVPSIRFYRWRAPALSLGYFVKFADVAIYNGERDLVRRWTGGGIVFHGEDLTYAIVIPASNAAYGETSFAIYKRIHDALCEALNETGMSAELVGTPRCPESFRETAQRAVPTDICFANPVRADVVLDGRKIAGAAQRRTRQGLLQQGSIQKVDLGNGLADRFARALSVNCIECRIDEEVWNRAQELAYWKYVTDTWLRKR